MVHSVNASGKNISVPNLLTAGELLVGYEVKGRYISEELVPPHCFVRRDWVIQKALDMTVEHNILKENLIALLRIHVIKISKNEQNSERRLQWDLRLNMDQTGRTREERLPDIAIYSKPILGDVGSAPLGNIPVLGIEILSISTTVEDLESKKREYRAIGIKNYWVLKKSTNPAEGLEGSFFFRLVGKKYQDLSAEIQESGRLTCPDLQLELRPEDVWSTQIATIRFAREARDAREQAEEFRKQAEEFRKQAEEFRKQAEKERQKREELEAKIKELTG